MEGGDSKVSAQWLGAQRNTLREQTGKYLLSGGQAWRGAGKGKHRAVRGQKGGQEKRPRADPGQESWVTIPEARPLAPPSALFKSTKTQGELHSLLALLYFSCLVYLLSFSGQMIIVHLHEFEGRKKKSSTSVSSTVKWV